MRTMRKPKKELRDIRVVKLRPTLYITVAQMRLQYKAFLKQLKRSK